MLTIRLITVEDEHPELIYKQTHQALSQWLFVKEGLIQLVPYESDFACITNLEDWKSKLGHLKGENQLIFCTVDLQIPEKDGEVPMHQNGLTVINDVKRHYDDGLRCCVLSGVTSHELREVFPEGKLDVPFDFKGDEKQVYDNIVNYVRSQCYSLMKTLTLPAYHGGNQHEILLEEETGLIREQYLSRAPYFAEKGTWHVPTLIIGERGLGHRLYMSYIAMLAKVRYRVIDLAFSGDEVARRRANQRCFEEILTLLELVEAEDTGHVRELVYISGLDRYDPESDADNSKSCLWLLDDLLQKLEKLQSTESITFPISLMFGISSESRLQIQSGETRQFIRRLESAIGGLTAFPLEHLGRDEDGWTLNHPRIIRVPSLAKRGAAFIPDFIQASCQELKQRMERELPGYKGQDITLSSDLLDFLVDGTDWADHGNLRGLSKVLEQLFENYLRKRSGNQYDLTLNFLDKASLERQGKAIVNLDDVKLFFPQTNGENLNVVENIDFKLMRNELLVILGPSGCGKSTILKMVSGLLKPSKGIVTFDNKEVKKPTRAIGFIFQDYSLFPWLTVRQNIEFGPKLQTYAPYKLKQQVDELLEIAGLQKYAASYPKQLSGGMQQRAAIIRALANDPDVLLMDEPFSALDVQTRWEMQEFLIATKNRTHKSIIFVTHDIDEAVFVGDRIIVTSPRPLKPVYETRVSYSYEQRNADLRRDPIFVAQVEQVRDELLKAAANGKEV